MHSDKRLETKRAEPRQHERIVHEHCEIPNCNICDGGLFVCKHCGKAEVELSETCTPRPAEPPAGERYFDPKDLMERWSQLFNHATFTSDPHAIPSRYATLPTADFDQFNHDFSELVAERERKARLGGINECVLWLRTHEGAGPAQRLGDALTSAGDSKGEKA